MTNLVLNVKKEGDAPKKLTLNTKKGQKYTVELSWSGNVDLDLHAFLCVNSGYGAKVSSFDDILSTYNVIRVVNENGKKETVGTLQKKQDGTFSIWNDALVHSPDATTGVIDGVDEWVTVDVAKLPDLSSGVYEIPLLAMIHPQSTGNTFSKVSDAAVKIKDANGTVLCDAHLSNQFGQYIGVQMGSIVIENGVASYVDTTAGFKEDINEVLAFFS